jgi:hypothetical protein
MRGKHKENKNKVKLKLDKYEGPLTRRKRKQLHTSKSEEIIHDEKDKLLEMAERNEEIHEGPHEERREGPHEERQEERRHEEDINDGMRRFRNPRRMRDSPLDMRGEQHELPILPKGTLKEFSGDGTINAKIHVDLFSRCL